MFFFLWHRFTLDALNILDWPIWSQWLPRTVIPLTLYWYKRNCSSYNVWWGFWAKFARDQASKEDHIDIRKAFAISIYVCSCSIQSKRALGKHSDGQPLQSSPTTSPKDLHYFFKGIWLKTYFQISVTFYLFIFCFQF